MTELAKDHLSDPELEEALLSTVMDGKIKVRSLFPEHFTHGLRRRIYELLRDGVAYVDLAPALRMEGVPDEETAYVTDIYQCPGLPRAEVPEAVANLKRLEALRRLCASVDHWRRQAPMLTAELAVDRLRGVAAAFAATLPAKSPPVLAGRGTRGR
jgi:hypothetical protein